MMRGSSLLPDPEVSEDPTETPVLLALCLAVLPRSSNTANLASKLLMRVVCAAVWLAFATCVRIKNPNATTNC